MFYTDANGIEHESFEAACHYYGADTPAQLAAEAEYELRLEREADMDAMVARGGPVFRVAHTDDIPF